MNQLIIVLDDIPPSNNLFLGQNKTRWKYDRLKKHWNQKITQAVMVSGNKPERPFEKAVVHLHYVFPDRRRRDPDNYSGKMLLDPLTANGLITDDSFSHIELVISAEVKKGEKLTVIEITEVEELRDWRLGELEISNI